MPCQRSRTDVREVRPPRRARSGQPGERRAASGGWRVAGGEWRVASGERRVASGGWGPRGDCVPCRDDPAARAPPCAELVHAAPSPSRSRTTRSTVDGARIHYLAWGSAGRRGLVFVHGGGANAHWWTHVAARFADDYRVVALDLTGHGDSDHRATYQLEQWTDEVLAVAAAGGIEGQPVVVGHSLGGFVTIATAARHSDAARRRHRLRLPGAPPEPGEPEPPPRRVRPAPGVRHRRGGAWPASVRCRPSATTSTTSSTTSPAGRCARSTAATRGSSTATCSCRSAAACAASPSPTCRRSAAGSRCCAPSTA